MSPIYFAQTFKVTGEKGGTKCKILVTNHSEEAVVILGLPFLRAFHFIVNYDRNMIGLANKQRSFGAEIVGKDAPGNPRPWYRFGKEDFYPDKSWQHQTPSAPPTPAQPNKKPSDSHPPQVQPFEPTKIHVPSVGPPRQPDSSSRHPKPSNETVFMLALFILLLLIVLLLAIYIIQRRRRDRILFPSTFDD